MASSKVGLQQHKVVSPAEWLAARKQFLAKEKEFTRMRDELSRQRRELPWEKVAKNYTFDSPTGKLTLADLFDNRGQLIAYHFMFGPGWKEGCPSCSMIADQFDAFTAHLANRGTTLWPSRTPQSPISKRSKNAWAGNSNGCHRPTMILIATITSLSPRTKWPPAK